MFTSCQDFPGIHHITDEMGVSFTLITGEERAMLFDTGYGTENVRAYVESLTDKPCAVYLSHGHHDHILGARWFAGSHMFAEDLEEFALRTGTEQREKVRNQATEKGIAVPDGFMTDPIPAPEPIRNKTDFGLFERAAIDLGGLQAEVIRVPGHTPGSAVVYISQYQLLLTGDDWNPCCWIWFPTAEPAQTWRDNMLQLVRQLEAEGKEIRHVYCAHQARLRSGSEMKAFLGYMTDERLENAPAIDMNAPIRTHAVTNEQEQWTLIFDYEKYQSMQPKTAAASHGS